MDTRPEVYTSFASNWGIELVFAITQSLEQSEKILADAVAAMIAEDYPANAEKKSKVLYSARAVGFASTLWRLSEKYAFRGLAADSFFRLPVLARAAIVLKVRAQFSIAQIATILSSDIKQVSYSLENARLVFSGGQSWLAGESEILATTGSHCENLKRDLLARREDPLLAEEVEELYSKYIGRDLSRGLHDTLHEHLLACRDCRSRFSRFKQKYVSWISALPAIEIHQKNLSDLTKTAVKMIKASEKRASVRLPSPIPVIRRMLKDKQVQFTLGAIVVLIVFKIAKAVF
ncbi:MAG: zf-HC2 domain-containing protein [Bacteriovoracia bacterium]